ncbi:MULTISPECIES: RHS repeat-associated core domain-containing protein [unclassified Streptomyces]|uniref:RHS repeat-associated core domain-containing protein n=1 Tax=unclassified Streptomyces TaxID=2593676 RepID=UPI00365C9BA8
MAGYRPTDWHVLDLEKDPTPGDPDRVRTLAKNLHDFADDVQDALRLVKGMADEDAVLTMVGKTADVFRDEFSGVPKNLKKLKKSYDLAGDALAAYWPQLERAQALADKALAQGREAQADLSSAKSRLSSADSWVTRANKEADKYKDDPGSAGKDVPKPDEAKVRAATRDAQSAKDAHTSAQSDVSTAQNALDAAKKMAADARKMREDAAGDAKRKLDEASDAGIQNRKWYEEVGDWFVDNWDTIVAVCKVVVAVLGVIALIIGGPILGAIVLIAALVVLADTLNKYMKGQASLLDVAFAALDCIPGMKGLTTLGGLAKGLKGLGAMGLKGMAKALGKGLRRGADDAVAKSKPAKGRCKNGDPVDMISGEMLMTETDVLLHGVLRLGVARTHLSTYRWGRWFGPSWTSTLDQRLELDDEGVLFATEDGMILVYPVPGSGSEVLPAEGPRWPLAWDDERPGAMRVTDPNTGLTRHFAPVGRNSHHDTTFTLPVTAISDRHGNRVEFDYDDAGTPLGMRHSGGYHVAVEADGGRVTGLRLLRTDGDPTRLVTYGYDAGRLSEVYNSTGLPYRFTYDHEDRITSWTDRTGDWYRYVYDDSDRVVSGVGVDSVLNCTIAYDPEQRSTRYTNSLGHTTTYRHNERLQLISTTNARGESLTNEWDRYNRLTSQTDALGNTVRYTHDAAGNITTVVRPDGTSGRATYDELNQLVRVVTPSGAVWQHSYDRGNHVRTVSPTGSETRYAYDDTGGLIAVTDPAGRTSRARCDGAGLPVEFTDVRGAVSTVERDDFGRVTGVTDALGRTTRLRTTVEGRTVWRQGPDGHQEFWQWDAEGNLLSQTDRAGHVTSFTVGPFGQVAARTTSDGTTYSFSYDTELNLLSVADPQERSWQYTYDEANRLTAEVDFSGRNLTYRLDAMGALVSRTNGADETVEFGRDVLGRLTELHHDGLSVRYAYDAAGRVVRETGPEVTVEREYDTLGLLLSESIDGRTTRYEYDALGRRVRRRTPTGIESTWTYDDAGHPTVLDTAGHRITFEFDESGRETGRGLPGGVALNQAWDTAGWLSTQQLVRTSEEAQTLLQEREYTYRPDGIPTGIEELTSGGRRFTLDPRGRVTAVDGRGWTERYQYDETGNVSRAVVPGADDGDADRAHAGNRILHRGRTRYERDGEGRIVRTVLRLLNGQKRTQVYTWNSRNQLIGTTTRDGDRWRYLYDSTGRRVAKQRLDGGGGVCDETLFVWDGTRLIEQVTRSGRATSWDYSPGSHQPVAQLDRPGADLDTRFHAIVTDLSGSPSELVSADGNVAWQPRRTLWGERLPEPLQEGGDGGVDCRLRFPGQYADPETGWHYNYQRHYDPGTAQYTSPDPLGLAAGPNDSSYVPNPYRWIDPLGLHWQDPNNGMQFGRDPSLPEGDREYTRSNQYPSEYRTSTHDYMVENYTDEGRAAGGVPLDSNDQRVPRDQLTWRNGNDELIWDPHAENPKPFNRTVTYEHLDPVVQHWNREGRFSDRATRNDFYNNTDHLEPMDWSENSRGGGRMTDTYIQEVGEGYSCS